MPQVSIIIPVYNAEGTISACLESIFEQTYKDFEVIVCDGESSDNTPELIKSFGDKITVSSKRDLGVYDAMNRGLDLATGDWVYFIGSDDVLAAKDVLAKVFSIQYEDVDLILGTAKNVNLNSTKIPSTYRSSMSSKILWRNSIHHQSAFYRRSVFDHFRYDADLKILADYHLNLRLYKQGVKAIEIDELIAVCDADGLSKQFNSSLYKEEIKLKSSLLSPLSMLVQRFWVWSKYVWKNS